jgi:hypothetical protein
MIIEQLIFTAVDALHSPRAIHSVTKQFNGSGQQALGSRNDPHKRFLNQLPSPIAPIEQTRKGPLPSPV